MSLERIRAQAAAAIAAALESEFGYRPEEVLLEVSPRRDLGDLAWPGALPLAKVLRQAPRQIAETVASSAAWPEEIGGAEVAGPGFLNLYLRRDLFLVELLRGGGEPTPAEIDKIIIEHTNINPNKAAHIGHLRNAVLGDILARCLRHLGHPVEVQNYIDDTGVQVADVVVGVLFLPETELAAVLGVEPARRDELLEELSRRLPEGFVPVPSVDDFDDLCWQIYPKVTARYEADPEFAAHRAEVLHAVEEGHGGLELDQALHLLAGAVISGQPYGQRSMARLAAAIAEGNVRCHLATMGRLSIAYDLLPHESDILVLGFWQRAFELLVAAGAVRLESVGKNAGCWVMSLEASPEFADMDDPDHPERSGGSLKEGRAGVSKILVRSNGTVTYTGKDIAYQLWKLGLLRDPDGSRHDFGYAPFASWSRSGPAAPLAYDDGGQVLARTCSDPTSRVEGGRFGSARRVINVIDVRQSYPQKVVREAVRVLGHPAAADQSVHFAYEMVALTPAAVRTIEERTGDDFGLSADDLAKPFVEMSGRRGIGVRADEILDVLVSAAEDAVLTRLEGEPLPQDMAFRAPAIAAGALRYLMARQSRNRVLAFDFEEALAFEGDTGPYLQYSAVRARKIFEKLAERRGETMVQGDEVDSLVGVAVDDDLWELVLTCGRRRELLTQATASLELSLIAQHVHSLAQLFHKLYHAHPVVPEEDAARRLLRRAVFTVFVGEMQVLLEELLGIPVPEEM